jgi:hypothetical protein
MNDPTPALIDVRQLWSEPIGERDGAELDVADHFAGVAADEDVSPNELVETELAGRVVFDPSPAVPVAFGRQSTDEARRA